MKNGQTHVLRAQKNPKTSLYAQKLEPLTTKIIERCKKELREELLEGIKRRTTRRN